MEQEKLIINEAPAQQVYIIQLDHNAQFDPQALPLHILENDIDEDIILPMLQQKHGQPLQLFIEPQKEISEVVINGCHKSEMVQNTLMNPEAPVNINSIEQDKTVKNEVHEQCVTVSDLINLNKEPTVKLTANGSSPEVDRKASTKQKIKNFVHMSDTKAPPRAIAVLPAPLHIRWKTVLPRRTLPACIRFGPVQGIRKIIDKSEAAKLLSNSTVPIFLLNEDKEHVIHIDMTDKDKSNWLGLLPLGEAATSTTPTTANVWLYEESKELYALTVAPIGPKTPLKIGYGKKYCEDHNISEGPVLDLEIANSVQWWCNECNRSLPSPALLQRHTDVYHKVTVKPEWAAYRCKYCRRPFGRLFTLKRHMHVHCTKNPKKSTEKNQRATETNDINNDTDINLALEDGRIPSDESFQNFTNSLDFSTNLFDTDRMASLDLSGHSRADNELNPYSIGFRDDNDLGFTKLTNGSETVQNDETYHENNTPILETCSYCNQVVAKESKSKHLRQCPSRLICECGRVFRHKKSLALHIHKTHPRKFEEAKQSKELDKDESDDDKEKAYKCQECPLGFKRRGMLVNHLWRKHKMISTMPVEKKVKRYPCVVCPRIYCSASKRNKHVRVHHPGAEKLRVQSIEGGVKCCQPASCSECPRQYATRAKLLQHIRAQHPHLANAIYKQELDQKAKTSLKTNKKKREATVKHISNENQWQLKFY